MPPTSSPSWTGASEDVSRSSCPRTKGGGRNALLVKHYPNISTSASPRRMEDSLDSSRRASRTLFRRSWATSTGPTTPSTSRPHKTWRISVPKPVLRASSARSAAGTCSSSSAGTDIFSAVQAIPTARTPGNSPGTNRERYARWKRTRPRRPERPARSAGPPWWSNVAGSASSSPAALPGMQEHQTHHQGARTH
jgi:hypothetical protein